MLNPISKKKKSRKKRVHDVLGEKQRYEPLEIMEEGGSLATTAHHSTFRWKGAFLVSSLILIPILVYYIFDKSGLVIVVDKRSPDEAQPNEPIVEGTSVAPEPKETNEAPYPLAPGHKEPYQPPVNGWPSDKLKCADDLLINFSQSFQDLHQENAIFCDKSSNIECTCESTVDPAPQSPNRVPTNVWQAAFQQNAQIAKTAPPNLDVVLLGDSITEHLAGIEVGKPEEQWEEHSAIFDKLFTRKGGGDIDGMALGIGGDRCAQLLYRLQNGELPSNFTPKVWWVLIGTFDLSDHCSAEATLMGIIGVIEEIRMQRPNATIVINSILPRPRNSHGTLRGILWIKSEWINQRLECFASGLPNVEYFDASDIFVDEARTKAIKNRYSSDWQSPSALGTQKWGEAIVEKVKELIQD